MLKFIARRRIDHLSSNWTGWRDSKTLCTVRHPDHTDGHVCDQRYGHELPHRCETDEETWS